MSKFVKIGDVSFNISEVEKLTEKEFIEAYKSHYKRIGKGRVDKMKQDYKELKKSFKKRLKKKED